MCSITNYRCTPNNERHNGTNAFCLFLRRAFFSRFKLDSVLLCDCAFVDLHFSCSHSRAVSFNYTLTHSRHCVFNWHTVFLYLQTHAQTSRAARPWDLALLCEAPHMSPECLTRHCPCSAVFTLLAVFIILYSNLMICNGTSFLHTFQ